MNEILFGVVGTRRPTAYGIAACERVERLQRTFEHLQVVGIAHTRDIPAVTDEARGHVVAESERRVPLDGDLIVVVDPTQVGELEVPRQ